MRGLRWVGPESTRERLSWPRVKKNQRRVQTESKRIKEEYKQSQQEKDYRDWEGMNGIS